MGAFLHADDIYTVATSVESLQAQINFVKNFAARYFFDVNVDKINVKW